MADELVRALQMLKKDWIEPPVMTSKVEKDNSWLHNELWKEGFLNGVIVAVCIGEQENAFREDACFIAFFRYADCNFISTARIGLV